MIDGRQKLPRNAFIMEGEGRLEKEGLWEISAL
jgi:hypothetical protein